MKTTTDRLMLWGMWLVTPEDSQDGSCVCSQNIPSGVGVVKTGLWLLMPVLLLIGLSSLG